MTKPVKFASLCMAVLGVAALCGNLKAAGTEPAILTSAYSAPAMYDLGNFYARIGRPALAVLNYERARIFSPTDADITANLGHVRETVGLSAQPANWLSRHARIANPNTMYWIGIAGLTLAGAGFLLRRLYSSHRAMFSVVAAIGALATTLSIVDAMATVSVLHESVVMESTAATSSPVSGEDALFTLPQAAVVRVDDEHEGFVLVRDEQGRQGWVDRRNLSPIIPRQARAHELRRVVKDRST